MSNIAPDWPLCCVCNVLKADGIVRETNADATVITEKPMCQQCAFDKGFAVPERFNQMWKR